MWKDEYLQWRPNNHDGIKVLNVKAVEIWRPDVTISNRYMYYTRCYNNCRTGTIPDVTISHRHVIHGHHPTLFLKNHENLDFLSRKSVKNCEEIKKIGENLQQLHMGFSLIFPIFSISQNSNMYIPDSEPALIPGGICMGNHGHHGIGAGKG